MLSSLSRFNSGQLLTLYRNYAKSIKKPLSWELVFDQRTPKPQAIRVFRQKLSELIENRNPVYINNPQIREVLKALIQKSSISEPNFEKAISSLYKLILQQRIPDDEVYQVISRVCSNDIVNVAVPSSSLSSKVTDCGQAKPSLHIHAEKQDHLGDVIKEIGNHDKPVTKKELFQDQADTSDSLPSPLSHSHIDLGSLQEYLHKAEQEKAQRKYSWESSRRYNWDSNLNQSPKLSAGSLIFAYKTKPSRRLVSRLLQRPTTKTRHNLQIQKQPKDLLILNLERRSKIVIPASHTNSIFNINYRDLFGIINAPGHAPEEMLTAVNQLENESWQLIGDLYDNSENVVFQRSIRRSNRDSESKTTYKIPIIFLIASLTVWGAYHVIEPKNQSKKSNHYQQR